MAGARGLAIKHRIWICKVGMVASGAAAAFVVFLAVDPLTRGVAGMKLLLFCLISDLWCLAFLAWCIARLRKSRAGNSSRA